MGQEQKNLLAAKSHSLICDYQDKFTGIQVFDKSDVRSDFFEHMRSNFLDIHQILVWSDFQKFCVQKKSELIWLMKDKSLAIIESILEYDADIEQFDSSEKRMKRLIQSSFIINSWACFENCITEILVFKSLLSNHDRKMTITEKLKKTYKVIESSGSNLSKDEEFFLRCLGYLRNTLHSNFWHHNESVNFVIGEFNIKLEKDKPFKFTVTDEFGSYKVLFDLGFELSRIAKKMFVAIENHETIIVSKEVI